MFSQANIKITGHVLVKDLKTDTVLVDKFNAINAETMSIILATMLQGNNSNYIYEMHFGGGGTITDTSGDITYKDVEENLKLGTVAELYSPLYSKVVDSSNTIDNDDETRNNVTINHLNGLPYTDLIVTCTLEENQPESGSEGNLKFDEIGLKSKDSDYLLSHIVFEPVEKTKERVIQVVYTLRISL